VIGNAVRVMRIATGEEGEDVLPAAVKDETRRSVDWWRSVLTKPGCHSGSGVGVRPPTL
jgi:hypothetical protein